MVCSNCGQTLREGASFCDNCGTDLTKSKVSESEDALFEKYESELNKIKSKIKRSQKRWLRFCWICSLISALTAVICRYFWTEGFLSQTLLYISVPLTVILFIAGIRNRFYVRSIDRQSLNQIEQAYRNAQMMK